ncbi:MAG: hypothetical protein WD738_08915 [Pirellulales bacterium]
MQTILIISLVLLIPAAVLAYFAARTWHWGHVLVVLGIYASTIWFFWLAYETLRINAIYRSQINQLDRELANVKGRNEALAKGTEDPSIIAQLRNDEPPVLVAEDAESMPSLADLDHQLLLATRVRGPVWRQVAPAGIDPQTGAVQVNIPSPVPAGIKPETVVFVFEEGPAQLPAADGRPQGAQYLGEFRVSEAAGQQATLQPGLPMDEFERARLGASRGPWVIYETMPADRHEVFADMSEEELKQKVPPQSVEEYLRHGKAAGPDDPPERQVGLDENGVRLPPDQLAKAAKKIYQRRLRDYATEFDESTRRRIVMVAEIEAVKKDIERLLASLDSANKLQTFRKGEIQRLNTDLAGIGKERQAIERHLTQVGQQLARVRELLDAALKRNSELAAQLATRQLRSGRAVSPAPPAGPLALGTVN